jgi:hypothetical protein
MSPARARAGMPRHLRDRRADRAAIIFAAVVFSAWVVTLVLVAA